MTAPEPVEQAAEDEVVTAIIAGLNQGWRDDYSVRSVAESVAAALHAAGLLGDGAALERAEAEVAHWKDHAEEAGRGFAQVCRDYARVSARNVALVEALERVRGLAAEWETDPHSDLTQRACAALISAALGDQR